MEIFTNWIFWVSLATILFIFAMIGFLTDKKKKKNDKAEVSSEKVENNSVSNNTEVNNTFNLASPVHEEVLENDSSQFEVQESILDTSGNVFGKVNSSVSSDVSLNNLGSNVQMVSDSGSLNSAVERNQVKINSVDISSDGQNQVSNNSNLTVQKSTGSVQSPGQVVSESSQNQISNSSNLTVQNSTGSVQSPGQVVSDSSQNQISNSSNLTVQNSTGNVQSPGQVVSDSSNSNIQSSEKVIGVSQNVSSSNETSDKIYNVWN